MARTKSSNTLLSVQEVAKVLGVCDRQCRGLIKSGTIKSVIVGKRFKVRPSDLEAYLNNNTFTPTRVYTATRHRRRHGGVSL